MDLSNLTYAELCDLQALAESARFANWLAGVRLRNVRERERSSAQVEKAEHHEAIADVWFAIHREVTQRIRETVEAFR